MHWLERWLIPPTSVLSQQAGNFCDLTEHEIAALPRIKNFCPQCAEFSLDGNLCGSCLHHPPAFDQTQVAFSFQEPVTRLIHELKYHQQMSHARLLAELFWHEQQQGLLAAEIEALLPVPIHPWRRRQRGYNQAQLLADELGRFLGVPVLDKALLRVKHTESQTHLDSNQRHQNLRGAFAVQTERLSSLKRIAIVDDVITTGATMQALAKQVKKHSAVEFVAAWAIAKTKSV
ncbi:competence protein ComFC [uncultured Thiomicrorhabdus sp.]